MGNSRVGQKGVYIVVPQGCGAPDGSAIGVPTCWIGPPGPGEVVTLPNRVSEFSGVPDKLSLFRTTFQQNRVTGVSRETRRETI